jgi:tetratricopeptide (TPR) repeat protein
LWAQAYVNYKNAVDLAPERPEAHFRMALTFTALKQYSSAVREFKKSIDLDPTLPQSGDTLSTIFGNDVKTWESQVMPVVAAWTQEDLRDTDRLFLLGLLLYFNEDPRGSEMMEAAKRTPGVNDYILAFTNPAATPLAAARHTGPRRRRDPMPPQADPNESTIEVAPDEATQGDLPLPPAPAPMDSEPEPYPLPPPT